MRVFLRFPIIAAVCLLVGFAAPAVHATGCGNGEDSTFTVYLPPALEYQTDTSMRADSIVIPNGRPIYALLVHGFTQNKNFDLLLCYNFARHLMQKGAYVHYAWWNNLCAEYMGRPLHQDNSHPGAFAPGGFLPVLGEDSTYGDKARPAEDYQFQADASAFLQAIRDNNPSAIIIVAGHSMGGAAVSRLGSNTDVLIDILAPLDPVENRGVPMGRMPLIPQVLYEAPIPPVVFPDYNFTRWRIAHDEFRGYKQHYCVEPNGLLCDECGGLGDRWYGYYELPLPHSLHVDCGYAFYGIPWWNPFVDSPPRRQFHRNIVNLFHRYQKEYMFPFDYLSDEHFDHNPPPKGSTSQESVSTCWIGWNSQIGELCWGTDGHGEIVGYWGAGGEPPPLGLQAQGGWPTGVTEADRAERRELLIEMGDTASVWSHTPKHPELCMVSPGLIALFDSMNVPPEAMAGADQVLECMGPAGTEVTLDGSASIDADGDVLSYTWEGPFGQLDGPVVTVMLPLGVYEITLTVSDSTGHMDCDLVQVAIVDTQPPALDVVLTPNSLWPPNHKLVDIEAEIEATDVCDDEVEVELISIVSNEDADGRGDGHTSPDINGASFGTPDRHFRLRAERAGSGEGRVYTVSYRAVDVSGNDSVVSVDVVVGHASGPSVRDVAVLYEIKPDDGGGEALTATLPGTDALDVRRIDAASLRFLGLAPVRRTYRDVVTPMDGADNPCDEFTAGPDGYEDLLLTFDREAAAQALSRPPVAVDDLAAADRAGDPQEWAVIIGRLIDATPLVANGCMPFGLAEGYRTPEQPVEFGLDANFPNPFNLETEIGYHLPRAGHVRLDVFDLLGRRVRTLVDRNQQPGAYRVAWNGTDASGNVVATGLYFYRLQAGAYVETRKMLLLK